jgi:hypothetical protein
MPSNTNAAPTMTDEQLLAAIDARLVDAEAKLAELDATRQPLVDAVERLRNTRAMLAGDAPASTPTRARSARKPVDEATRLARAAKAKERREARKAAEAAAAQSAAPAQS